MTGSEDLPERLEELERKYSAGEGYRVRIVRDVVVDPEDADPSEVLEVIDDAEGGLAVVDREEMEFEV